jgi:large subunit ribosomal protein L23
MSTAPVAAKADPKAAKKAAAAAKPEKAAKADKPVKADKPAKAAKPAKAPAPKKAKPIAKLAADGTPAPARSAHDPSRLAQVLIAPIVSEKATLVAEKHNQILFKVLRSATKPEIKAAVEQMWPGKTVVSVQTVQHKGKSKRFGKSNGRRDHVKKAYVSLAAGQELNFSGEGA